MASAHTHILYPHAPALGSPATLPATRYSRAARIAPGTRPGSVIRTDPKAVLGMQERRRRRRVATVPMYTCAIVRILSAKNTILEGHILDISETGVALEVDSLIPVGTPVTVEFRVSGLGKIRDGQWSETVAAAEVVRQDREEDFPQGPYKVALRFVRMSTIAQAQIARYAATHPDKLV